MFSKIERCVRRAKREQVIKLAEYLQQRDLRNDDIMIAQEKNKDTVTMVIDIPSSPCMAFLNQENVADLCFLCLFF